MCLLYATYCSKQLSVFIFLIDTYVACEADFSGGLFWNTGRRNSSRTQLCSTLHPNFRSGVNIQRHCENNGTWSSIDTTNCTMFMDSLPVVMVSFTAATNNTETIVKHSALIIGNVSNTFLNI